MVGTAISIQMQSLEQKSGSNISVEKQVRKNSEHKNFQQMTQQKSYFWTIPSSTFKNFFYENLRQRQTLLRKIDIVTNGELPMIQSASYQNFARERVLTLVIFNLWMLRLILKML